jgi:hypothetical protein
MQRFDAAPASTKARRAVPPWMEDALCVLIAVGIAVSVVCGW